MGRSFGKRNNASLKIRKVEQNALMRARQRGAGPSQPRILLLNAGRVQILQMDEPRGVRERLLERSEFTHERNHLGHSSDVNLSLLRQNLSLGFK